MRFTFDNLYKLSERVLEESLNDPDSAAKKLSELLANDCQKWAFWQKTKLYECVYSLACLEVASIQDSFDSLRDTPALKGLACQAGRWLDAYDKLGPLLDERCRHQQLLDLIDWIPESIRHALVHWEDSNSVH